MKWMIASDLHGSAYYCEQMLEAYRREGAGRLVLLGDLLYHGPRNPFPRDYDTMRVTRLLNSVKKELLCVRGNCDSEVDQMVLEFPIMADYAVFSAGDLDIFATHGHVFNEEILPPLKKGAILLHGHTHLPVCVEHENYTYVNPGSASLPKEDTWRGYILIEDGLFRWKDFQGVIKKEKSF